MNSPFCLVSRRRRAWRVRSGYPRMTSPCCSRRVCTSSPCPSSSTWRPTRWSSSSPSSHRSPSLFSGASSSGCAAGECAVSSVLKHCPHVRSACAFVFDANYEFHGNNVQTQHLLLCQMSRMGSELIFCICVCVAIDAMLNIDGDFEVKANAGVTC